MENHSLISSAAIASASYTVYVRRILSVLLCVFQHLYHSTSVKLKKKQQWADALCMSLTSKTKLICCIFRKLDGVLFEVSPKNR